MAEPQQEQPTGNVRPMTQEEQATIERTEKTQASQYNAPHGPAAAREESREFTMEELEAAAIHEQLADDTLELLRAQNQLEGEELDDAFYEEMRGIYRKQSDERLRQKGERLVKEMVERTGTK